MNTFIRTVVVFVVGSFVAAGSVQAQDPMDATTQEAAALQQEVQIAQKQAQAAQRQAEVARMQALALEAAVAQYVPAAPATVPTPPEPPAPVAGPTVKQPVAPVAPTPPSPPAPVSVSVPHVSFNRLWPPPTGGASTLVIPSAETKAEDILAITEDMNVMSRIFKNNLEQARITTVRGSIFTSPRDPFSALLGAGSGAIESMYLQGYGALFFVKVDFPLSGPPQAEERETQADKEEQSDPVWEETRRQMYEPQQSARRKAKEPEEKYDAEKVENLKTTLIGALKHAANIRSLKPDESVVLTITGSSESGGPRLAILNSRAVSLSGRNQVIVQEKDSDGKTTTRLVQSPSTDAAASFAPTILVIRVKKSDIDQLAKGTLNAEQFRQRVQVLACPYLGVESGHFDTYDPF